MKAQKALASLICLGLVLPPGPAVALAAAAEREAAAVTLQDVRGEGRTVSLPLSKPAAFRTSYSSEPPALTVTLDNTTPSPAAAKVRSLGIAAVTGVSVQLDAAGASPVTRIVLTLDAAREFNATWAGDGLQVQFRDPATAPAKAAEPAAADTGIVDSARAQDPKAADSDKGYNPLVESISTKPIDFNFRDADLLGILRNFAVKFNKNIITGPGVGGRVNMQLRDVPFDEAFGTLLSQMDLIAIQKSRNIIEIIKASDMPVLSQIFALKYRFAPDIEKTITSALGPKEKDRAVVSIDPGANAIIVTSTTDILEKLRRLITQIDVEPPQVAIRARLMEVTAGHSFNWATTFSAESRTAQNGFTSTGRAMLETTNLQASGSTNGAINTALAVTKFPNGGVIDFTAVLDRKSYYGLINALKSDTSAKTISEPMVLTGNNKVSKIHVGQNLPVKQLSQSQTSTVQNIQFIQEGVDLEVTPVVSPGSNVISFKIRVGVSEFSRYENDAPVTTERTATTEVSVESGKTIVIAGLIRDKQTLNDSGIPILKDIPLIGYFFKKRSTSNDKTELVIFITPELLVAQKG